MNKMFLFTIMILCTCLNALHAKNEVPDPVTEPYTYRENFEDRELGAWASYPHWQDLAYDQNFRVNEMVPGDPNISLEQKVTPYTNVDNYAGAQKLINMFLVPGSKISLRYYLKTNLFPESFKIRFAAGMNGKIDVTILKPKTNKWMWVTVGFSDFVKENNILINKEKVEVFAVAVLAKFPNADPAMPIYLGLDDIAISGARMIPFQFIAPTVYKLPEFNQYIPQSHYNIDDTLKISGHWRVGATKVSLEIFSFTDLKHLLYEDQLSKAGELWSLNSVKLSFPAGLYVARLSAFKGLKRLSLTEFTIHVAPSNLGGKHPRLLFDSAQKKLIEKRFSEERFKNLYTDISKNAKILREKNPVESIVYDLDQYPDENWLPSWLAWGTHIYALGEVLHYNSLCYSFHDDLEAGRYVKDVLLKLCDWPNWTHPWLIKRGKFADHRSGAWSHRLAEAYDLTYNLMTGEESARIRKTIMKQIVQGVHNTYVYNDDITANTSNWLAGTVGGSLMNMAAMFEDGPETENLEPYFTGAIIKYYTFMNRVADSADGSWGEGLGYYNYSLLNMCYNIPSIFNVFNIDLTSPLANTYNEFIWGGMIKNKKWFEFGDSGGDLMPVNNWAFLLAMRNDPRLSWLYNFLKDGEKLEDVLFETNKIKPDSPFNESPVKVFRKIGTTVFKSGWEKNDMVFVMRTGPFYNHQHLDQGSFWFADRGITFVEERPLYNNSNYYDDPLYQSHFIQPIGHSTILIDSNQQSQRVGDHLEFAPGFNDHAFIAQFLDGKDAAFSRGDIGRLYWSKAKSITRNVLFIKPRTVLMLDEVIPGNKDVDVTLLYQTANLKDITAGQNRSTITKQGVSLHLIHLAPNHIQARALETPHYIRTLQTKKPLFREGMLALTARTDKKNPLLMANLLTTTMANTSPDVTSIAGDGFITGLAAGKKFAFSTKPGNVYKVENLETDALCMSWSNDRFFVAMAKVFHSNAIQLESKDPITFELFNDSLKYYRQTAGQLLVGVGIDPLSMTINGVPVKNNFRYEKTRKMVFIEVPAGEGIIVLRK